MFIQKTQTESNIEELDKFAQAIENSINSTINLLNLSHSYLWNLPDEQLINVLQWLYDKGMIEETFNKHYQIATAVNGLANIGNMQTAKDSKGREFTIDNGIISLVV